MAVLDHHIVFATDAEASARYYREVLGLDQPVRLGEFAVIEVGGGATFDFITTDEEFDRQHYAFLVTESEFDEVFDRITNRGQTYWADPTHDRPDEINYWDDGRGVYFDDPDGHRLEILTRPYGSAGTEAEHPHPLIAAPIEGSADAPHDIH